MQSTLLDHALDDEFAMHLSSPSRPAHRRTRSDPSDILQSIRAERSSLPSSNDAFQQEWMAAPEEALAAAAGGVPLPAEPALEKPKRDLSPTKAPTGFSPALKKQASLGSNAVVPPIGLAFELAMPGEADVYEVAAAAGEAGGSSSIPLPLGFDIGAEDLEGDAGADAADDGEGGEGGGNKKYSKKDVPMWTVEEDLLILQLVEKHGKRWSKIASHLPGRTDNGVRNRWNRMERAQVLRKARGPAAGYRCRRCGEPKRGHICAARTVGEVAEGEDLHKQAAALTELSAMAMKSVTEQPGSQPLPPQQQQGQVIAPINGGQVMAVPTMTAHPNLANQHHGGAHPGARPHLSAPMMVPKPSPLANTPAAQGLMMGGAQGGCSTASRLGIGQTPFNNAIEAVDLFAGAGNVEDFLDELRKALDDTTVELPPPPPLDAAAAKGQGKVAAAAAAAPANQHQHHNHNRMSMMSDASTAVASTVSNDSSNDGTSPMADVNALRVFGIDLAPAPRTPTILSIPQPPAAPGSLALSTTFASCQQLLNPPTGAGASQSLHLASMLLPSAPRNNAGLGDLVGNDLSCMKGLMNGHLFSPPQEQHGAKGGGKLGAIAEKENEASKANVAAAIQGAQLLF